MASSHGIHSQWPSSRRCVHEAVWDDCLVLGVHCMVLKLGSNLRIGLDVVFGRTGFTDQTISASQTDFSEVCASAQYPKDNAQLQGFLNNI